jgi:1,4-alpha-glucan branching enzyme
MHDTLAYFGKDPVHRRYHHDRITFSIWYAFAENFVLPLSHDEVVYGKRALLDKMPRDAWQRFANLRLLFGCMWTHPGKKLLFMGGEFGQSREWNHEESLDWGEAARGHHAQLAHWVGDLNRLYRGEPALHQVDFDADGFRWIDCNDAENGVIAYLRRDRAGRAVVIVCNLTPVPRHGYVVGLPHGGAWRERLNSDAPVYGGSGLGNGGAVVASGTPAHGLDWSAALTLPPLAVLVLGP